LEKVVFLVDAPIIPTIERAQFLHQHHRYKEEIETLKKCALRKRKNNEISDLLMKMIRDAYWNRLDSGGLFGETTKRTICEDALSLCEQRLILVPNEEWFEAFRELVWKCYYELNHTVLSKSRRLHIW
jgi:hypothetical protein